MRWETSYLHNDVTRCVGRPQVCNHLRWCQSVESSVDDLRTGRGVVLGRAVPMLRSVETQPLTGGFVLMAGRIPDKNLFFSFFFFSKFFSKKIFQSYFFLTLFFSSFFYKFSFAFLSLWCVIISPFLFMHFLIFFVFLCRACITMLPLFSPQ